MTRRPIVLFIGDDASSTQIAESLLRRLVGDSVEIHTAGTQPSVPGGREDQMLVMMGLNPAHEERLSVRALHTSDRVIVLGATLDVARVPGREYEEWDLSVISLEQQVETLAATVMSCLEAPAGVPPAEEKRRESARQQIRGLGASGAQLWKQVAIGLRAVQRRIGIKRRPPT